MRAHTNKHKSILTMYIHRYIYIYIYIYTCIYIIIKEKSQTVLQKELDIAATAILCAVSFMSSHDDKPKFTCV